MERIIPTHFVVDCPGAGHHFGPISFNYSNPEMYRGVKFVWKIKRTGEPLADRMIKRQIEKRITERHGQNGSIGFLTIP